MALFIFSATYLCYRSPDFLTFMVLTHAICTCAPIIYYALQSIWLQVIMPTGIIIENHQLVRLQKLIHELAAKLKVSPLPILKITATTNAAVMTVSRIPIIRPKRHYLLLGLPLLATLSTPELKAILCHELSHLLEKDTIIYKRIHNLQKIWQNFLLALAQHNYFLFHYICLPFFSRYIPFYCSITAKFSQIRELKADALAAYVVGCDVMAQALISISHLAWQEQHYWQKLYASVMYKPSPPSEVYLRLLETLQQRPNKIELNINARQLLTIADENPSKLPVYLLPHNNVDTARVSDSTTTISSTNAINSADTHPSVLTRIRTLYNSTYALSAIFSKTHILLHTNTSSKHACNNNTALIIHADPIIDATDVANMAIIFNTTWQQDNLNSWHKHHSYLITIGNKYRQLQQISKRRTLTMQETNTLAITAAELFGNAAATKQLELLPNVTTTNSSPVTSSITTANLSTNAGTNATTTNNSNPSSVPLVDELLNASCPFSNTASSSTLLTSKRILTQLRNLLDHNMHHFANPNAVAQASLLLQYGKLLLNTNITKAIACFERALWLNHELAEQIELTISNCWFYHRSDIRIASIQLSRTINSIYRLALRERIKLNGSIFSAKNIEFYPHDLPAEHIANITHCLKKSNHIRSAWLLRKKMFLFPSKPFYVLVYVCSLRGFLLVDRVLQDNLIITINSNIDIALSPIESRKFKFCALLKQENRII